jgi:hypothetical protein
MGDHLSRGHRPRESDERLDPEPRGLVLECRALGAVAEHRERQAVAARGQKRGRLERQRDALLPGEPRDDDRPTAARGPRPGTGVYRHRMHVVGGDRAAGRGLDPARELA